MTDQQKKIINRLQEGLPICHNPYEQVADELDIPVETILEALKTLRDTGLIRRYGGIIDINSIDIVSTLVGLKVDPNHMSAVANTLNDYHGITHNYERSDDFNLWFTLMAGSKDQLNQTVQEISKMEGIDALANLPSKKKHKTKVIFKL